MPTFHIDTPCCTPDEFARRTGLSKRAIEERIGRGQLPRMRLDGSGKKELVLVNLVGVYKLAEQQAESFMRAVNEG